MPYPSSLVGHSTDPISHDVDSRWTMAYAAGIGDELPAYFDTRGGVVVHPAFPVCLEWPAVLAVRAVDTGGAFTRDELLSGVHATHDLTLHRPIEPSETLMTTATVVAAEPRRPGTYEVLRLDTVDRVGEPVATTFMGSLFLGVPLEGEAVPAGSVVDPRPEVSTTGSTERAISVAAGAAHVYTECSRIYNPIHTDAAVAASAGLPGPILHGTATLAMAVSRVVASTPAGDARMVRSLGCRFGAMVPMPDRVAVVIGDGPDTLSGVVPFEVVNGAGRTAIGAGWVTLA